MSAGELLRNGLAREPAPVAVLLDDGEDADADQLDEVQRLADDLAGRPSLIVVAARPSTDALQVLATWPRLVLPPLAMTEAVAILQREMGADAPPAVVYRLAEELDGNPLALHEVPHLLSTEQCSGTAPLPAHLPVPPALDRAWGHAIDGLPVAARAAAVDLAIVGPRADLLAAMSEDNDWGHADLAAAVDAGVAVATSDVTPRFVHAVVRDVLLPRTPATALQQRHARAATPGDAAGTAPADRGPPPRPRGRDGRRGRGSRDRGAGSTCRGA